ncbi:MAG: hypothetical protein JSW27_25770 [Phycisphaerales bacterium]|nr:MAG: hypothetical protein JSW27_25770 [Phycisphaerales bacterium]
MNRTQKSAWFLLGGAVLALSFMGLFYAAIFAPGDKRVGIEAVKFSVGLLAVYTVVGLVLVFRRQSPAEPESDERDKTIQKNAAIACFVSVWASLALSSLIPSLVVGRAGSIPVFLLAIINLIILQIAFLVYGIAVLVQYGRAGKGDAS